MDSLTSLLTRLNLLSSGDESDVTVKVQGEEFRLHRAILTAHSPVFRDMFRHDAKEKATGVVSIEGCEAGPFRAFVNYLYTGSTEELSLENVFSLFQIADKYQVEKLSEKCLDFLKSRLSVDTFCAFVDFAQRYDKRDLIEQAVDFLSENYNHIMHREDWLTLYRVNVFVVNVLIKQVLMKPAKIR